MLPYRLKIAGCEEMTYDFHDIDIVFAELENAKLCDCEPFEVVRIRWLIDDRLCEDIFDSEAEQFGLANHDNYNDMNYWEVKADTIPWVGSGD